MKSKKQTIETRNVLDREVKIKFSNVYAVGEEAHEAIFVLDDDTELKARSATPELAMESLSHALTEHVKKIIQKEQEEIRQNASEEFAKRLWEFTKKNYDLYLLSMGHGRTTCIEGQVINEGRCQKCNLMALGRQLDWIDMDEFRLDFELDIR